MPNKLTITTKKNSENIRLQIDISSRGNSEFWLLYHQLSPSQKSSLIQSAEFHLTRNIQNLFLQNLVVAHLMLDEASKSENQDEA